MSNDQLEESSSDSQLTSPEYPLAATPSGCVESSQRSKVDTENATVNARSENEIKRTFLWHTHNYLNEYIRFCDKKAALTGTISTGLIGAMYSAGVYIPLLIKPREQWNLSTWLTVLAVASLLISVILVVATVAPRLSSSRTKGFLYWGDIAAHDDANSLKAAYESQSAQNLDAYLLDHVFHLSKNICVPKYRCVSLSIWALCTGGLMAIVALVLHDAP